MAETAAGLAGATPSSLVVLDELGRGTATFDGYALAYAVLAHLGQKTGELLRRTASEDLPSPSS
jgi:DNA mismatch repair protein MSH6